MPPDDDKPEATESGSGYRYMEPHEIKQVGDQVWSRHQQRWFDTQSYGMKAGANLQTRTRETRPFL